jgi:hypothetical protein
MDKKKFIDYLSIYGADLGKWPEGLRESAHAALSSSRELLEALEEEKLFEEALNMREFEEPSPDLARRIIYAAEQKPAPVRKSFTYILSSVFSAIPLPRPALALPLLLILGIAAGYIYAN